MNDLDLIASKIDRQTVTQKELETAIGGDKVKQSDWNQSNINAVDYIKNKPSIPAAQIQSDWNQTDNTKLDYIKNKPTVPEQVQADWNQTDENAADYIKNKPNFKQEFQIHEVERSARSYYALGDVDYSNALQLFRNGYNPTLKGANGGSDMYYKYKILSLNEDRGYFIVATGEDPYFRIIYSGSSVPES